MKTKLKYEKFIKNMISEVDRTNERVNLKTCKILDCEPFNYQWIFKFENGYGASVIKHWGSYGFDDDLFELAIIEFYGDSTYHITYDTPITDDVIGYLNNDEVMEYLEKIKKLTMRCFR